ncbi:MAG: hypothetical protein HY936_06870 [Nitrosomonadales bacterium]|nr:hypothetical protein [Nitrosomonadales bacterium]
MSNEIDLNWKASYVKPDSILDILETTLMATATAGLLYFLYFQLAPWIWSQNIPVKPEELMPWLHYWLLDESERDGIELYALYALMFLDLLFIYALGRVWNRFAGKPVRYFLALPLVALSFSFIRSIGFQPPMNALAGHAVQDILARSFMIMAVILPIIVLLYYLQKHSARWTLVAVAYLLIPVCFISTRQFSWEDIQYVFAPALRLLHGAKVSEIYFQYDLLPSLIALAWMKLQLDLNLFQMVAQWAYYLLLLSLFAFSRQWFLDKRLPVFLLVALVLVRIYAGPDDAIRIFQVTPFRLDLWLILLLLVYFKGAHHWSAGLFCGLMLLFHKNFGIIYSAAYIQLLLTLCVLDASVIPGKAIKAASMALRIFFKNNYPNLVLILMGALAHYLTFRNADGQIDFYYQQLGIGFMKIASNSFYWYVVAMSGLSFALLLGLRTNVSRNYLAAGLCLIYLMIGNSLYFFGRSHENNIINISAILVLLFFLLLDLGGHALAKNSGKLATSSIRQNLAIIVSLALITSITIWYGDSITNKAAIQARNIEKWQFIYPPQYSEQDAMSVIAEVKSVTGDNPKVYFVSIYDFLFNYYGGYAPAGYYNPLTSWISRREFNKFLQELVDHGYYLVIDEKLMKFVQLPTKAYHYRIIKGNFVIWNV